MGREFGHLVSVKTRQKISFSKRNGKNGRKELVSGDQINLWTVVERAPSIGRSLAYACRCICGYEKINTASDLRRGRTKGCRSCARHIRPYEALYNLFVGAARRRNISCSVTYEDFLIFTAVRECHYCGNPVVWAEHNIQKTSQAYNLDRMDNTVGYHAANVTICCATCNATKLNLLTYEEMVAVGAIRRKNRPAAPLIH